MRKQVAIRFRSREEVETALRLVREAGRRLVNRDSKYICFALDGVASSSKDRGVARTIQNAIEDMLESGCTIEGHLWHTYGDEAVHHADSIRLRWLDAMIETFQRALDEDWP